MNTADNPVITTYLAAVREALSDLPADELADILEELREHLDEVVAELGPEVTAGQLAARLGTPRAYAAELRSAAGFAPPTPAVPPSARAGFGRRLLRFLVACAAIGAAAVFVGAITLGPYELGAFLTLAGVLALAAGAGALLLVTRVDDPRAELRQVPGADVVDRGYGWLQGRSWGPELIEFVRSLRPAWWVARALAVAALAWWFFGGTALLPVLVFVAALAGSVWLGRRSEARALTPRARFGVQALNVAAGVAAVFVLAVAAGSFWRGAPVEYVTDHGPYPDASVYDDTGEPVTNLFPYGPDGRLLENVRLYDQNGRPFAPGPVELCYEGAFSEESFVEMSPWGENVFPRRSVEVDETTGACERPRLTAPFGPALPDPAPSGDPAVPSPSPTPTVSPTPLPTPTLTPTPATPVPPGS